MRTIGEQKDGFLLGIGLSGEHRMVATGMQAQDHFGARGFFDPQALGADGHASIAADSDARAHAPDVVPPGAARRRSQDRAAFLLGLVPGPQGGLPQLSMNFVGVAMGAQIVDVSVGFWELGNLFAGEVRRESALPELMFPLDLTFGLGGRGVAKAHVVKPEGPAQLGQRVGLLGEENAVKIHIELEGTSMGEEGSGQEVEIGELGPRRGVVAAGGGGRPSGSLSEGAGAQVIGKESVEAAAGAVSLSCRKALSTWRMKAGA